MRSFNLNNYITQYLSSLTIIYLYLLTELSEIFIQYCDIGSTQINITLSLLTLSLPRLSIASHFSLTLIPISRKLKHCLDIMKFVSNTKFSFIYTSIGIVKNSKVCLPFLYVCSSRVLSVYQVN